MSLHDENIATLIPHAGSMCLLSGIDFFDAQRIVCRASSHRDSHNPLRHADQLSTQAGIEYAAQAVAVHGGLLTRQVDTHAAPRGGMIAVLTDVRWQVERLDTLRADLTVSAERIAELPQGLQYRFALYAEQQELLSGEMIIALQAVEAAA
ncbi:MAG: hypothetical protein R3E67_06875 [Pseudomonadales bacterium]